MFKAAASRVGDLVELELADDQLTASVTISIDLAERLGLALIAVAKGGSIVTDEALHELIDTTEQENP